MEQYLSVGFSNLSCSLLGLASSDELKVAKVQRLFDAETGEIVEQYYGYEVGHTYICKEVWIITKGYKEIKAYFSEEEAKAEYNRIVDEIRKNSKVIDVK